jgi:hypothetical protein
MIVRVDALPIVLEARRVVVAEVVGGYHGEARLGRWWLPSAVLADGEQPGERAVRLVKDLLGLDLDGAVIVGARSAPAGGAPHLGLVVAGAVVGGEPSPRAPASGFAARTLGELPDQVGFWHRDELAILVARYERLRAP